MKIQFLILTFLVLLPDIMFAEDGPRVFVFTDINIDSGDPDDRQSLIHLFWYSDYLSIEGVVPERWNADGYEACQLVLDAYNTDYFKYNLKEKGFANPDVLDKIIARDVDHSRQLFRQAASNDKSPLYVLIWGNMKLFYEILSDHPEVADNICLITIGTGLMAENNIKHVPEGWEKLPPCKQMNWNGAGRNNFYQDPRFKKVWWIEINWTYEGMFSGDAPGEMFEQLSGYGSMGMHIKEVVKNEPWAQYFRVGDTPSVLYVIDPDHDLSDPGESSWAGKFAHPFPGKRPDYYTDFSGNANWNYDNPCTTWENHYAVIEAATGTLLERRDEMYEALINKLDEIYDLDN